MSLHSLTDISFLSLSLSLVCIDPSRTYACRTLPRTRGVQGIGIARLSHHHPEAHGSRHRQEEIEGTTVRVARGRQRGCTIGVVELHDVQSGESF